MRISVFGLGYVGAVSAACLSRDGHAVVGCDIDTAKLALLGDGRSPIVEPGMEELVARVIGSGCLRVTANTREAVSASEVSLVCVGTPAAADGSQDLSAIRRLAADLGTALAAKDGPHLVAVRSTLLPGTMEKVIKPLLEERSAKRAGADFDVAFVPEFLREGSSIADYDRPPFTIAGVEHERATAILRELYGRLPAELCFTSIRTAELLKYACNAFHALKITFANELGRLGHTLGVDPVEVMDLFCKDQQLNLSAAYLRPAFAFGGPCLPKDLQALISLAEEQGLQTPLLSAIGPSNEEQIDAAVAAIRRASPKRVGLLGLSFKSGTNDLRTSPLVALARRLIDGKLDVRIYDPQIDLGHLFGANRRFALDALPDLEAMIVNDPQRIAAECDVLVVGRGDQPIVDLLAANAHESHVVIDLAGLPGTVAVRGRYERV